MYVKLSLTLFQYVVNNQALSNHVGHWRLPWIYWSLTLKVLQWGSSRILGICCRFWDKHWLKGDWCPTRLPYLVQYYRGKAKESIENCILMEPVVGYQKAFEILAEQFGQPHLVMHALLHKVTSQRQIRPNDGNALWDLTRDLRKCQITLSQLGYNADMNSSRNLLKV